MASMENGYDFLREGMHYIVLTSDIMNSIRATYMELNDPHGGLTNKF